MVLALAYKHNVISIGACTHLYGCLIYFDQVSEATYFCHHSFIHHINPFFVRLGVYCYDILLPLSQKLEVELIRLTGLKLDG